MKTRYRFIVAAWSVFLLLPLSSAITNLQQPQVVFDGNSLVTGFGIDPSQNISAQVERLLPDGHRVVNYGVSAQTTQMMWIDAHSQVDRAFSPLRKANILVVWEVTNDLYLGQTPKQAYQNIKRYCVERKAAGWQVILIDVLPRSDGGTPSDFEKSRREVNHMIQNDFQSQANQPYLWWSSNDQPYADLLIDIASDSTLSDNLNPVYYLPDQVHLSPAGYAVIAKQIATGVSILENTPKAR